MGTIEFKIFNSKLVVSEARDRYVTLKNKYSHLADKLEGEYEQLYIRENNNIDDVSKNGYMQGCKIINKAIDVAIDELVANGVYEIDRERFIQKYYDRYFNWEEYFDKINDKYLDIVLTEEEKDAYRTERRLNRSKWQGGGFGLEGAIKGAATAGAMNVVGGIAHGAFNLGAKLVSAGLASMDKAYLFKNPSTLDTLKEGIYVNVVNIHYALINALSDSKGYIYDYITQDNADKVEAMVNNLDKISENIEEVIIKTLELDPFNKNIYDYILNNNLDKEANIVSIADYFDVYIEDVVQKNLMNYFESAKKETEEDALIIKQNIMKLMKDYNVQTSNALDKINEILHKIDIEKRTFKEFLYETREEKVEAENQDKKLKEMCSQSSTMARDELKSLLKQIRETTYLGNVADEYLEELKVCIEKVEDRHLKEKTNKIADYDRITLLKLVDEIKELGYTEEINNKYIQLLNQQIDVVENQMLADLCGNYKEKNREQLLETINAVKKLEVKKSNKKSYLASLEERIRYIEEKEIKGLCINISTNNEMQCMEVKERIINLKYSKDIEEKYLGSITQRIESIWSKEDGQIFDNIYLNTDIFNQVSVEESIQYITNSGRTESKNQYLEALKNMNDANIGKAKKYLSVAQQGMIRVFKKEIIAFVVIMLICLVTEATALEDTTFTIGGMAIIYIGWRVFSVLSYKKIYNILTLRGKIIHPALEKTQVKVSSK